MIPSMPEWLVTNGLGSYASLTQQQQATRKYHGLLVASLRPPTQRWVFVSHMQEHVATSVGIQRLSDFQPDFTFDFFPTFIYKTPLWTLEKTVMMPYGSHTTLLRYRFHSSTPVDVVFSPRIPSRHVYDVIEQDSRSFHLEPTDDFLQIHPDNSHKTITMYAPDMVFDRCEHWVTLFYEKDRERQDSWVDHAFSPGTWTIPQECERTFFIGFSIEDNVEWKPEQMFKKEQERLQRIINQANLPEPMRPLLVASDRFLVEKHPGKSVIAGYHWFSDWGRDTLIALPGLTLVTKRFDDARAILHQFSTYCRHGLIPNVFGERDSQAAYNTVDASLWFVDRVFQYLKYTNDHAFLEAIWNTLESICQSYRDGTEFGIHMDDDYLITHGPGLTWMDVKMGDFYPTPRAGKAVEIQALWYNALRHMGICAQLLGKDNWYDDLANHVQQSFQGQYNELYDVIDTKDTSLRCNMVFLVSLDFPLVTTSDQQRIISTIQDQLHTPFGLRTLSPFDSRYKSRYLGDYPRDITYHNGIVWPWLLGSFITGFLKVHKYSENTRRQAFTMFLEPMFHVFGSQWDGSIPELFDAEPPFAPRGCISQAWSVSEILRSWVEDITYQRPPFEQEFLPKIRV